MSSPLSLHRVTRCFLLGMLFLLIAACAAEESAPPPEATRAAERTASATESAPPATSRSPETTFPTDELGAALEAFVAAGLPQPTPDPADLSAFGIQGVRALPLEGSDAPLWAVFTHGMRNFDPMQNHFVAIYAREDERWEEVDRIELEEPDYLAPDSVTQVFVEPEHLWLAADGGAGAHSGTFALLRFDGQRLQQEVTSFSPSPGAGRLSDLDDDGTLELILDRSDPYVFCYACGVRAVGFELSRWNGTALEPIYPTPLPDDAPARLRDLNNRALALVQGGLWKAAQATIVEAQVLDATDPVVRWNAILINLHADAMAEQVEQSAYPLLDTVFYGDYDAALEVMQAYRPEELFTPETPLLQGTAAEGFQEVVSSTLLEATSRALSVEPDLAAAHFLRGWAIYLATSGSPAALFDVARAAEIEQFEARGPFFAEAAALLTSRAAAAPRAELPAPLYFLGDDRQIMRLEQDGLTLGQVTHELHPVTDFDVSPVDGALLFVSNNDLIRTEALGDGRTLLVDGPTQITDYRTTALVAPRWSPSGEEALYTLNGVNVIPATGGTPRALLRNDPIPGPAAPIPAGGRVYQALSWSPDGARLLVHIEESERLAMAIYTLADSTVVEIQSPVAGGYTCCNPVWSPDGARVYFSADVVGTFMPGLWRADAATGQGEMLVEGAEPGQEQPFAMIAFPTVAADGGLNVFYDEVGAGELDIRLAPYHLAIDGSGSSSFLGEASYDLIEALWARDGSGAVVLEQSFTFGGPGPVQWVPISGEPAVPLAALATMVRWGAIP